MALVPDDPIEVTIQMARADFITQKVIRHIPDDVLGDESLADRVTDGFNSNPCTYVWSPDEARAVFAEASPDSIGDKKVD